MKIKREFRKRLLKLYQSISDVLYSDNSDDVRLGNLFPHLFSVYTYLWSNKNVLKK